jgi:MFS transporter, SP family, sugar:H+ symporter
MAENYDSLKANWKCMLAIVLVSLSPFQYGIDFGLIGGIQAMIVRDQQQPSNAIEM